MFSFSKVLDYVRSALTNCDILTIKIALAVRPLYLMLCALTLKKLSGELDGELDDDELSL